jgi:cell wall-associated NlpC family hydrolase
MRQVRLLRFATCAATPCCLLACLAAALACTPAAFAEPDARGEAETAALASAQQEYDEAQQRLSAIGAQLESTQLAKHQTESALADLRSDIADTQAGIDDTTSELAAAQAALAAYLQISYKSGGLSILDVLMSSVDFNDFVTRSYYVSAVQDSQVETIEEIKGLKLELEEQEEVLSGQEAEEAELLERLEAQEATLVEQKAEADELVAGLSAEVQELFAAQQAELSAAAEARATAASAAAAGEAIGVYTPGVSQGSVVENAYACLGIPYVWGGDDESFATDGGYDCSGFVQHCYALEGYTIGRTTWDQIDQIQAAGNWKTSVDELEPGDLVFPSDSHVGIYIGNGQMIDAPYPGMYIRIDDISDFIGGGSPV